MEDTINQLRKLLNARTQAQLYSINQYRNESYRQINNDANSRGLLFSSVPANQQYRAEAKDFLPAEVEARQEAVTTELSTFGQLAEYQKAISELNTASSELGG